MKKFIITLIIVLAAMSCMAANNDNSGAQAPQTEQTATTGQDPVVGTWKGHEVHRGAKGGLYYWHTPKTGKNAGKQVKRYLSKQEKEEFNASNSK